MKRKTDINNCSRVNITDIPDLNYVFELWLDSCSVKVKKSTVRKYEYIYLSHIKPEFGTVSIKNIDHDEINKFLNNKRLYGRRGGGSLSFSYVQGICIVFKSVMSFAAEMNLAEPLQKHLHVPSPTKSAPKTFRKADIRALEAYLLKECTPVHAGILLSLRLGLRLGEVCALTWEDIDFDESLFYIRHTISRINSPSGGSALIVDTPKTASSVRTIPLPQDICTYLRRLRKITCSHYVASTKENCFLSPRTMDYNFDKILGKLQIDKLNYHSLRHSFATNCVDSGVDVKTLSEILGHSDVSTTLDLYVHSSLDKKRAELEKLSITSK